MNHHIHKLVSSFLTSPGTHIDNILYTLINIEIQSFVIKGGLISLSIQYTDSIKCKSQGIEEGPDTHFQAHSNSLHDSILLFANGKK